MTFLRARGLSSLGLALWMFAVVVPLRASGESATDDPGATADSGHFSFAVVASDTSADERRTAGLLQAVNDSAARFVVHFERAAPSPTSCADASFARRRSLLEASAKPVVPVSSTSSWASCGAANVDPLERLERVDDVLFGSDESLGQTRLPWLRQSAIPRFRRFRENLRWQVGRVLFATLNVPDDNNAYRFGAGRNGEFDDRVLANRAWLDRTLRIATERKVAGVVLIIDASPRFNIPLRAPDLRGRDRDGYYEWKVALRDAMTAYKGPVLLIQNHHAQPAVRTDEADHPLHDAAGRPFERFQRIAGPDPGAEASWLKIDVDPSRSPLFAISTERMFDDPSGELYGPSRVK